MAPTPNTKAASNRLMGMKFMQRAAAGSPASPSTPGGPPSKRQRLSTGGEASPSVRNSDLEAVKAAIAEEEAKRAEALERQAAAAGETRWVLSFRDLEKGSKQRGVMQIRTAGYADLDRDAAEESEDEAPEIGRRSFGKPAPKAKIEGGEASSESDSDSSESDEDPDEDPASAMIREQRKQAARESRKQKKKAEAEKMAQMAEKRRKKEVKLNRQGGSGFSSGSAALNSPNASNITCHVCGNKGHLKRDCPQKGDTKKRKSLDYDY